MVHIDGEIHIHKLVFKEVFYLYASAYFLFKTYDWVSFPSVIDILLPNDYLYTNIST